MPGNPKTGFKYTRQTRQMRMFRSGNPKLSKDLLNLGFSHKKTLAILLIIDFQVSKPNNIETLHLNSTLFYYETGCCPLLRPRFNLNIY